MSTHTIRGSEAQFDVLVCQIRGASMSTLKNQVENAKSRLSAHASRKEHDTSQVTEILEQASVDGCVSAAEKVVAGKIPGVNRSKRKQTYLRSVGLINRTEKKIHYWMKKNRPLPKKEMADRISRYVGEQCRHILSDPIKRQASKNSRQSNGDAGKND